MVIENGSGSGGVGGGGAGYSRFQVTGMIEWGQKIKNTKKSLGIQTKATKIPGPQFNAQKSPSRIPEPSQFPEELRGRDKRELYHYIMNLQIVLNNQNNPFLNQGTPKLLAKIFLPPKIPTSKISNPKKSFDHPCHLKSGVPLLGRMAIIHPQYI